MIMIIKELGRIYRQNQTYLVVRKLVALWNAMEVLLAGNYFHA